MTFCSKTPQLPAAGCDLVRKVLSHLSALRSLARATLPQMAEFLRHSSALLGSRQETTVGEGKPLIWARLILKVFQLSRVLKPWARLMLKVFKVIFSNHVQDFLKPWARLLKVFSDFLQTTSPTRHFETPISAELL